MHVSGRMGWDVGEIKAYYLCSPSPFTFFSTRPVSCWIPVFMLFTAVHRPHRLGSKNSEPVWTGEVFLTAHLHKDLTEHTHTQNTRTFTLAVLLPLPLLMGGKFDPAGSVSLLFSSWLVSPQWDISGPSSAARDSIDALFFSPLLPSLDCQILLCQINYANLCMFAHCTKLETPFEL